MSTQLKVFPFHCPTTHSPSFKLQLCYPANIPNLSYNFQLHLQVSMQKLLPRISYEQVHEQTFFIPKKQVVIQNLQPSKMYQVVVQWKKKGLAGGQHVGERRVVFACSGKGQEEQQEDDQGEEVGEEEYGQFVKDNIKGYFQHYYHNQQPERSQKSNIPTSSIKNSSIASNKHENSSSNNNNTKNPHPKPLNKTPLSTSQSLIKSIGSTDPFISKKHLQKYILQARKSSSIKDYLTTKDYQCFDSFSKVYKNEGERRKHVEKTLLVSRAMTVFGEVYEVEREYGGGNESNGDKGENMRGGREFFRNDWFMGPFYSYDKNEKEMKKRTRGGNQEEEVNE